LVSLQQAGGERIWCAAACHHGHYLERVHVSGAGEAAAKKISGLYSRAAPLRCLWLSSGTEIDLAVVSGRNRPLPSQAQQVQACDPFCWLVSRSESPQEQGGQNGCLQSLSEL